jgi:hypothetical protein
VKATIAALSGDRVAASKSNLKSAGENPDIALAMYSAELDDFFFERGRVRLCVGQHQLLGDGVVDSVGFDVKVVVVTDDKCHLVKRTSNEPRYKIFSTD